MKEKFNVVYMWKECIQLHINKHFFVNKCTYIGGSRKLDTEINVSKGLIRGEGYFFSLSFLKSL